MKIHPLLFSLALVALLGGCGTSTPPGFSPVTSATARIKAHGFSVQAPGLGWLQAYSTNGVIFGKRVDPVISYHAGISVVQVAPLTSREVFLQLVKGEARDGASNPRCQVTRDEFKEEERDGLWVIVGRLDFDDRGAVNVGAHGSLKTWTVTHYVVDPQKPEKLATVWFSWRGLTVDDAAFGAEAERFLGSVQRVTK